MLEKNKMLSRIAKTLGMSSSNNEEPQMIEDNKAPAELANNEATVAELSALKVSFAEQSSQLTALLSQLEEAKAALAEVEAAKASLETDKLAKQLAARKQRVEMAIGTEKAPALLAATENLEDAQFEAIVGAMAASFENESKSQMFQEVGVSAEVDPTKTVEESAEMRALKQKYQAK